MNDWFIKLMLVILLMWNINNMAHFNNIRHSVLDNNNKITKIAIKVGAIKAQEDDY